MKKNRKNNYTKTTNLFKIIFLFIVFLGIGYAFLDATLNINGDVTVTAPELNVYVQGTSVTTGSTTGTPTIIGNDKKEVDFSTALTNDGNSFFEETTTVVNKGTGTPYLLGIDVKVYDSSDNEVTLAAPYEYTITNGDGTPIQIGTQLAVNATASFKFKFNYVSGTDMTTVTDYPTYTFKITYNYGMQAISSNNDNITTLSATKCTANENATVPNGTICKRAINLHQEECTQTDSTLYCSGAGYTASGSKGTTTITYGNCGTQSSNPVSGDAFTCDVNGDGTFDELTERFYYVSDYYDTTTKTFDATTATLIYYSGVSNGIANNKVTHPYELNNEVYNGPITLKEQLPTTTQWSNVSLKSDTRAILAEYETTHDSPEMDNYTPLPTNFSYSGYAARFLTAKELMSGCGLSQVPATIGALDSCNYLVENTEYSKSNLTYGSWLETPLVLGSQASLYGNVWVIGSNARDVENVHGSYSSGNYGYGARPVIEVPKASMSY